MNTTRRKALLFGLTLPTLLLCSTTVVSHTFGRSTYGLLLPAIEDDLGLSHSQSGLGGTAIYAAYVIALLTVVVASPHVEPITIMRWGLFFSAVGLAILSFADSLPVLIIGLAFAGGSGAGIWMTAPVVATVGVPPERRGLVIGLLTSSIGAGTLVLGFGVNALRAATGNDQIWRPVWVVATVFAFGLLAAIVLVVRFDPTEPVTGGFSLDALRAVPGWLPATIAYALFGCLGTGFSSFLLAALEESGLSRAQASTVFSLMGLLGIIGGATTGLLSDRFGRPRLMLFAIACISAGVAIVALASGPGAAVGALMFGALAGSFPALLAAYFRDHTDDRSFSRAFSAMTIVFSFVALVSPGLVGWAADRTGSFTTPYLVLAAAGVGAFVATATLPRTEPSD